MIKIWRKGIVFFLYMQAIPNVFVILLRIATENNMYLGTWRKNKRVCQLTHPLVFMAYVTFWVPKSGLSNYK